MAYVVTFKSNAAKSMENFDRSLLRRIKSKVLSLEKSPRRQARLNSPGNQTFTASESATIESFTELTTCLKRSK